MKTTLKNGKKVEIKTLEVVVDVIHWEDAKINGISDAAGHLIPFNDENRWMLIIDIDKGIIRNWPKNTMAEICLKVSDHGSYYLKNKNGDIILSIENFYVPSILCIEEPKYHKFISINITEKGRIKKWEPDISSFEPDED